MIVGIRFNTLQGCKYGDKCILCIKRMVMTAIAIQIQDTEDFMLALKNFRNDRKSYVFFLTAETPNNFLEIKKQELDLLMEKFIRRKD